MTMQSAIEYAVNAYNPSSYISIDEFTIPTELDFIRRIERELVEENTPETIFLQEEYEHVKSRLFSELSEEAKQIVELIADCPLEMLSQIGGGRGRFRVVSMRKLARYLRKQWEEKELVKSVLQEVAEYSIKLESY
jgi:hypothetical protein